MIGLLLAALLGSAAMAQMPAPAVMTSFLGLNDTDPSVALNPAEAQSALNVESGLSGLSIQKRAGYSRLQSLTISTSPVSGSYNFIDANGSQEQVVCQDHNCAKSVNGGAFSVFLSTAGGSCMPTRWSFAQQNGSLYGANDCRDDIFQYDGTTRKPLNLASAPKGAVLELTKDRLVVSDVASNPNGVYYSQSGTPSNFTTGLNSADPYVDVLGSQGDRVTALKYTLGRLFIFKTTSLTSCILGDQYSSRCFPVSNTTGTGDPQSVVEVPGGFYFRGNDLNYWAYDGQELSIVSKKISNFVKTQNSGTTQNNTQTSQSDWQAGTQYGPGTWNTVTTNGSIFPSSFTLVDNTSSQFLLGTTSDAAVAYYNSMPSVQAQGVTSTYTFRYDALVLPDSASLFPYQWTNGLASGVTQSIGGGTSLYTSTLTIASPSGSSGGSYSVGFSVPYGTSTIVVFSAKVEGAGTAQITISDTGGANPAVMTLSSSIASYYNDPAHPATDSLTAHAFSTYTIIISTPGYVSYYRNGIFKSSGPYDSRSSNPLATPNSLTLVPGSNSSASSYTMLRFLLLGNGVSDPSPLNITAVSTFTSRIFDLGTSTPIIGGVVISSYVPIGTTEAYSLRTSTSPNNDMWGSYSAFVNGSTPTGITSRYIQFQSSFTQNGLVDSPGITQIDLPYATTGQYVTACIQPGTGISGWGLLSCAQTLSSGGSEVFYATSAASCAALPTVPPLTAAGATQLGWTAQTNNAVLSISTNAAVYIGWRSLLNSATDQAQVDACTLYWNNGVTAPPVWATFDSVRNAVYWTTAINNSASNNRVLKYDLNLNQWYPFSLNANAIRNINNQTYFGDSTGGYWNIYGGVNSDNGSAINSYWKSKDFGNSSNPFLDNNYTKLSLVTKNQVTGNMTVTLTPANGQSSSYTVSLATTSAQVYVHSNQNLPFMSPLQFMNVQFGNNSATPWEVDGAMLEMTSAPWRPQNP